MNISARPRKQGCWPNGQLTNLSRVHAPSSLSSSVGQSCVGPAAGQPEEMAYSCAVWLVVPSHQSVWGQQR